MKKYVHLHPLLIARITAEEAAKRTGTGMQNIAKAEKSVKTRLHQLYGAYVQPNIYRKAAVILNNIFTHRAEKPGNTETSFPGVLRFNAEQADALLRLHASTRERLPHYAAFYCFIFDHVPLPGSIIDLGCGFNPFSMNILCEATGMSIPVHDGLFQLNSTDTPVLHTYHAVDICTQQAALINRFFALHNLPAAAVCVDLAGTPTLPAADAAFAFKLLPVLETQASGGGFALLRTLRVKHLIITYPMKSLTGKEKGMARHYRQTFETAYTAGQLAPFILLAETQIGAEWVIILVNNAGLPSVDFNINKI